MCNFCVDAYICMHPIYTLEDDLQDCIIESIWPKERHSESHLSAAVCTEARGGTTGMQCLYTPVHLEAGTWRLHIHRIRTYRTNTLIVVLPFCFYVFLCSGIFAAEFKALIPSFTATLIKIIALLLIYYLLLTKSNTNMILKLWCYFDFFSFNIYLIHIYFLLSGIFIDRLCCRVLYLLIKI